MLTRLLTALTLITIAICFIFADVIQAALWWIAVIGALFLAGVGVITLLIGWQRFRMVKAQADKAVLEADFIPTDGWIKERVKHGNKIITEYALLDRTKPLWRVNSHLRAPEIFEREAHIIEHHSAKGDKSTQLLLPESTQVIDALQFALFAERAIVKGKSDAGKTTFLLALATRSKNVIVIDPHNSPDKWPGCAVIGGGENFPEISQRLKWLYDTMQQRYRDLHAGNIKERQFDPLTLITDEVLAIIDECPEAKDYFRKLVTRARKVNISVYLGSHSELVKPLGLEGAGDIRESYVFIRLYYSYITGNRSVTIDEGNGEVQAVFNDAGFTANSQPLQLPELADAQEITNTDKILDLFDHSGLTTPTAICMKIYGYKKTNLIADIRQTLVDNGRLG